MVLLACVNCCLLQVCALYVSVDLCDMPWTVRVPCVMDVCYSVVYTGFFAACVFL